MNKRYETVEALQAAQAIEVEVEGAWLVDAGDGKVRFGLNGVQQVEVDWPAVGNVLQTAGVAEEDQIWLVERFAQIAEQHLLAKALAKRIKRVG